MDKAYYPIALNLRGKLALVAGGGIVAERKVKALIDSGARVHVISPRLTVLLKKLANKGEVRLTKRPIRRADLTGAHIIIAATSDEKVNKSVSLWASKRKILVNVVDQPKLSTFISPAVFMSGKATIAVYTDGKDPVLSRDLKNFLKENWDAFLSYRGRL